MQSTKLRWRLLATACAATSTTDRAAARFGASRFLPALFVRRYANMGGLAAERFAAQIDGCRSFEDARWTAYWNEIAFEHLQHADRVLSELGAIDTDRLQDLLLRDELPLTLNALTATVAPYAGLLADHSLLVPEQALTRFAEDHRGTELADRAPLVVRAVRELLAALTYLQVSAFPGGTPQRMAAYRNSRRLFDALAGAFSEGLGSVVEQVAIPVGVEVVHAYRCLPKASEPVPLVVVTNGLEGTVQELLVPMLRYHASGLGVLVMEMPGSYAYTDRMSAASERIYEAVIDAAADDPRVDAGRIGIVGVSFGGYWAARMAAADRRLTCAVACGAPTDRSFRPRLGLPEVIIDALAYVTGATTPVGLLRRLRDLSLRDRYADIAQPLLVINGSDDTLLSTRDSIELAAGAPNAELRLYAGDDHCAMANYRDWLDYTQVWLARHLLVGSRP